MLKRILSSVLAVVLLTSVFPLSALADSGEVVSGTTGDCVWTLDGTVLTISGKGDTGRYYSEKLQDTVTQVIIENGVTSIAHGCFFGFKKLQTINIPISITKIGSQAFDGCNALKRVDITDVAKWCYIDFTYYHSNPLYYADNLYLNNEKVTDLVIPESVSEIKDYAFSGCTSIEKMYIPNSVKLIGEHTFFKCENLTINAEKSSYAQLYVKYNDDLRKTRWIYSKDNPLVSIDVPDVKIIENTNGVQKDGYYYYNFDYNYRYHEKNNIPVGSYANVKCIANFKDGEKNYAFAQIDKDELNNQETSPWVVGNTYQIKAYLEGERDYRNVPSYVNVSIIKNPIKNISVQNITVEEGFLDSQGYTKYYYDGRSSSCFSPEYTATLDDGTVLTSESNAAYENFVKIAGREYQFEVDKDTVDINSLKAGDSVKLNGEIAGKNVSYNLNIVASPFVELHIDDVVAQESKYIAGTYDWSPCGGYVVLTNGETINFYGDSVVYNDKEYRLECKRYDTELKSGETYDVEASLGNLKTKFKVTVPGQQLPDGSITVRDVKLITPPKKTEYFVGECFDMSGAVILVSYSDGTHEDVSVNAGECDSVNGTRGFVAFSKKLLTFLNFMTSYNGTPFTYNSKITVSLTKNQNQGITEDALSFEYAVTIKENDWVGIEIKDWFNQSPKIIVTEKSGNTLVLNVKKVSSYGGYGGGNPWAYNSMFHSYDLYTDKGIFYIDTYEWLDNGKKYANIYMKNKTLKSNIICSELETGGIKGVFDSASNKILYENEYNVISVRKLPKTEYKNGEYYYEQDFFLRDGTCKTLYMRFDSDLNLVSSIIENNPNGNAGLFDKGDINKNGKVDVTDLIALKKRIAENRTEDIVGVADLDGDGNVNALDLVKLKKLLIGVND